MVISNLYTVDREFLATIRRDEINKRIRTKEQRLDELWYRVEELIQPMGLDRLLTRIVMNCTRQIRGITNRSINRAKV